MPVCAVPLQTATIEFEREEHARAAVLLSGTQLGNSPIQITPLESSGASAPKVVAKRRGGDEEPEGEEYEGEEEDE